METKHVNDMTDLELAGHLYTLCKDLTRSRSIFEQGEILVIIGACCDTLAVRGYNPIAIRDLVMRSGGHS